MTLSGGHWYQLRPEWAAKLNNSWSTTLYIHDAELANPFVIIFDAFMPDGTKVAIHRDAMDYYEQAEVHHAD